MNILLLQPPISDFYQTKIRLQPLGLAYLKAAALKFHPEVFIQIEDLQSGHKKRSISLPKNLRYLQEYYHDFDNSPFSTFHHFYYFGASKDYILKIIETKEWDLIGISSLFTPYYDEVIKLATLIKTTTDTPILLGGGHPSALAGQLLSNSNIDYIIRGEGEKAFVKMIDYLKGNITINEVPSLSYRDNGRNIIQNQIQENYPIDTLPFPDLKELGLNKYTHQKKAIAFILTSRSCPYHCSFCSAFQVFGRKYRSRSNQNILTEIDLRIKEGYQIIDFEDDNLTINKEKSLALFKQIASKKYPIKLMAMNGISYHHLDFELLEQMKKAGFESLNISLVSSSAESLKKQNRLFDQNKFREVVSAAFSLQFNITSYIILGLPQETLEQMIDSIITLARFPVLIGASPFYLIPQTPIARFFADEDFDDFTKCRLSAFAFLKKPLERQDLYTLFVTCRIINFVKSFTPSKPQPLLQILSQNHQDTRTQKAAGMLKNLLTTKTWHQKKFKQTTFERLWKALEKIVTLNGTEISL